MKKTNPNSHDLAHYLALHYPITFIPEHEGGYTAKIERLPGCISQGETLDEAMAMIDDARRLWIEAALENGDPIPNPSGEDDFSGKILLRMPRSLHQRAAQAAVREGISLNQYLIMLISENNAIQVCRMEFQKQIHEMLMPYSTEESEIGILPKVSEAAPEYFPTPESSSEYSEN